MKSISKNKIIYFICSVGLITSIVLIKNISISHSAKLDNPTVDKEIAVNCTLYDYLSDYEMNGSTSINQSFNITNYYVFKAKKYDKLDETNTLLPMPIGSFETNDNTRNGYQTTMNSVLVESFGKDYFDKFDEEIKDTFSTVAAFNPCIKQECLPVAVQGYLDDKLQNGKPTQSYNGKTGTFPWFDDEFLKTEIPSYTAVITKKKMTYGKVYDNVKFPFRYDEKTDMYQFDSKVDTVRYNSTTNELDYKGKYNSQVVDDSGAGFYPFSVPGRKDLNYCFGVKIEIPFEVPKNKKNNGDNLCFEFKGDDDLWIFIDGYLALDLGGCHPSAHGYVDITKSKSVVDYALNENLLMARGPFFVESQNKTYTENELLKYGISGIGEPQQAILTNVTNTFPQELINSLNKGGTHTLTMFYMERARGTSNLNAKFNLPVVDASVEPTQDPDKSSGERIVILNGERSSVNRKLLEDEENDTEENDTEDNTDNEESNGGCTKKPCGVEAIEISE